MEKHELDVILLLKLSCLSLKCNPFEIIHEIPSDLIVLDEEQRRGNTVDSATTNFVIQLGASINFMCFLCETLVTVLKV